MSDSRISRTDVGRPERATAVRTDHDRFLGVDAYWALSMAINVYLAFFRGWTVERLRGLDVWYLLACYGLSFVPALVFIFIETQERGRIYGEAIIWCWVTEKWGILRIVMLYAIVW
jgi:hypothetical protein